MESTMTIREGARVGVLLINLGTPRSPTTAAVGSYLRQFLSDPRVIELPRPVWLPVLYGLVLPLRSWRVKRAYRKIWMPGGSPLRVNTIRQRRLLAAALQKRGLAASVEAAMCYGPPSVAAALGKFDETGVTRLVVLPLYPQYSSTTTAAAFDAVARALEKQRRLPEIHLVNGYHDRDAYIKACAARVLESRREHGAGEKLLFSFHGLPRRNVLLGDPYQEQCRETAALIAHELGLKWDEWLPCFQSRFGRTEWLRPYADETLGSLARRGVESVDVFCPGFAADCLETLEETAMQNRGLFLGKGGKRFHYVPALNDSERHIGCLAGIVCDALGRGG